MIDNLEKLDQEPYAQFQRLRNANAARNKLWDPESKLGGLWRGNELAGEIGELCNIIKKIERERLGLPGSRADIEALREEIADAQICLDLTAMHYKVPLWDVTKQKFNKTSEKMKFNVLI